MVLSGGLADKVGNRFEDRWTVRCAFDVLEDRAEAICLEPSGPENDKVEFWVRYPDKVEYHQCKRQRTREGVWTLPLLSAAGVLSAFLTKLKEPEAHCVFASTHATDALGELCDRARGAHSLTEFVDVALGPKEWQTKFAKLRTSWDDLDVETAFQALRRVRVNTIGEDELKAMNRLFAELTMAGDIEKSVPTLTDILRDKAGQYLTANDLWRALRRAGYEPNPMRSGRTLAPRINDANKRFRRSREDTLISGSLIERAEARQIRELITDNSVIVVSGDAGTGKSDTLLQFVRDLDTDGIAHLVFRLDRHTPAVLPNELGAEMGLPASPVASLMAHSKREIGVLVIDQLDIVSSTSGRSPIFFECVKEMLETASAMPNLRVVLSCRTFDSTNDPRLRRLVSSEHTKLVTIGSLAKADVHTTIEGFGFDAQQLTAVQSQMFSVPLHLALLAEVAPALRDESEVLSLAEPKDLFQAFWTHKHREIQHRLGREPAWTQVFDALVDYMSDNQVLRAPAAIADQWSSDLSEMTSSHVVTRDGNHIAFFHESFFDYVFARRFTSRQYTVADLLTADQGLFRRAQVRQILAYNRGLTPQYSEDLKYLLTAAPVRFHLRDVVLAWLARVSPTAEEWTLVRPFLEDAGSPLFARAWRTVATPNWFAHLDDSGLLTDCLHSDDESRVNLALRALACGDGKFLDRAVELLEPLVHESDLWSTRLIWLLQQVDLTSHRPSFDLLLELLDSGKLGATGFADREFWRLHDKLPVAKPDWANQLLGRYLAERIAAAGAYGPRSPIDTTAELIPRQNQLRDFIILAATRRPDSFIRNVWPEIVRIAESTMFAERDDGGRLRPDHIWPFNGSTDHRGDFRQELLAGAEIAFAELGRESPDQLLDLANSMSATPSETVVHVLFAGFAANPATLADQVIRLLGAHPNWLQVSWSTGHAWGARRLIAAITPFASSGALEQLTAQLLDYYPLLERSPKAYREFGLTQFTLLGGIPPEYRSPGVTKRFAEWQRKFGVQDLLEPTGVHGGFVQSPLASTAIDRMSDTNWRGAIARYNGDDTTFQNSEGTLVGGALQLANQLEAAAKASPRRFANLALTLPDSTDVRYFNAILRGVAGCETPLPTGLIEELLTRCHTLPDRPCGMYIATPLLRSEELQISESMCDLIIEYAMNDPDPGDDGFRVAADNIDENLLYRGLNSVRGAISEVIARLISQDARNIDPLMPAVLSLVSDRDMGVRSLAARCVISLEHWESSNAVLAFEKLVDGCTDHLLATRYVYEILRARIVSRPSSARTVIDRMARSEVGEVQMHGAMLNTLAALLDGRAADLATAGVSGTEYQRLGAAKVYAANRIGTRFAEQCAEPLVLLLNDGSQLVRDAAAAVITDFSEVEVDEYRSVVEALISTRAADEHWDDLILMVGESIASAPDLALMICEKILLDTTDDLRSLQHPDLVSLILLRVSIDFTGDTRTRALDLIDLLLQYEIRSTERALVLHDRGLE